MSFGGWTPDGATFAGIAGAFAALAFAYFALLALTLALLSLRGVRRTARHSGRVSTLARQDLLEGDAYEPISILVPAHDEERSVLAAVESFLNLHYPEFELIVISDGSTDGTVGVLERAFDLRPVRLPRRESLRTERVTRVLRSGSVPNLTVVEKEHGGKADALNAGLNLARFPLVCAVDADSVLDAPALVGASREFLEDDELVALGGGIRPLGERPGAVPRGWLERIQLLEYVRAFFIDRVAWGSVGALAVISGAFGLFRRRALMEVGGYRPDALGEDMELVFRMHRHYRDAGVPYRVGFLPEAVCWTEAPRDWRSLRRQRRRWQRGLVQALVEHRGMPFRPRYGTFGSLTLPFFWLFEAVSPLVEILGYTLVVAGLLLGFIEPGLALGFLALAVLFGGLLSQLALLLERVLVGGVRVRDLPVMLLAAYAEFLGYRQVLVFDRAWATVTGWRRLRPGTVVREPVRSAGE